MYYGMFCGFPAEQKITMEFKNARDTSCGIDVFASDLLKRLSKTYGLKLEKSFWESKFF